MRQVDKEILQSIVGRYSPGEIQKELAKIYENYSNIAKTKVEMGFWFKCARASKNLSSGMTKWAQNMIDALETGEEDETEGG